jgi:transforming growth factor-beta-induced protein
VAADLADTLSGKGPFTLFAPTNCAFNALPAGTLDNLMKPSSKAQLVDILTTHVLPLEAKAADLKSVQLVASVEGRDLLIKKDATGVTVSTDGKDIKKVVNADNVASNGVAHIIDGVLLPPAADFGNLVQLAEGIKDLSTLVSAVVAADLADTLSGKGPFTLFAPTNEAFSALPAGTLDNLMKPANKGQLADILTYHVLPEQVLAGDLQAFQAVTTVEGKPLHVQKWGGKVKVGSSLESADLHNVIIADNIATNGVAHVIDGVLLPKASTLLV